MRPGRRVVVPFLLVVSSALAAPSFAAKPAPRSEPAAGEKPAAPDATVPAASDDRPYDAALLRLAGKLGALTIVQGVCGEKEAGTWRLRMQALLDAEGEDAQRRDRLAGAYNEGLRGYALSYRSCTPNARLVVRRLLDETGRLARDIAGRYRPS